MQQDVPNRNEATYYLLFQLRVPGHLGMPGVHVWEHVILMLVGLVREAPVEAIRHAQEAQVKLALAQVWRCRRCSKKTISHTLFALTVEGTWSTWSAWGTCSGICNTDATWTRTRGSSGGNTPCTGSASESGSCTSRKLHRIF